jgi:endonuclease/exonuclease/phosphatase family metal-dependent hydrolase
LNIIGELQGFLDVQNYDVLLIVGDFNVASLLLDFMADNHLVASDLSYRSAVSFTYVRDDGSCRSWIDHVLCSQEFVSMISSVESMGMGSILSDHVPLCFLLHLDCASVPVYNPPIIVITAFPMFPPQILKTSHP